MSGRKGKPIIRRRNVTKTARDIFADNSVNLTLEDAFDYFVSYKRSEGVRERTMKDYHVLFGYFKEWLNEFYPDIERINDVTTAIIREYMIYLRDGKYNEKTQSYGLSPYTVNVRIRFLKAMFNTLHAEDIVEKNPAVNVKLMKVDEDTFEPLTDEEIDRLLKAPDVKEYAQFRDLVAMLLILDTGIRVNEIFNLEMSDVDFKTRAIVLPASKNKNRKPRILPLSNQVLRLLMELISEVKTHFDTSYVFVSNFGEKYNPNSFRRRMMIYKERAGIKKRVSPHVLRHQFCRDYILNGGDIFTLQRIVGHADISTTRKYIQFTTEDLQKQHALYSPVVRLRKKHK